MVLWTRLTQPDAAADIPLLWEVASDDQFASLIATGITSAPASSANAATVLAENLPSGSHLWYRFKVDDFVSSIGRTKTLPTEGATVDRFRFAVSSCQLMETGHYAAHRDLAAAEVDLVIWLGDYIYEGGGSSDLAGRAHRSATADSLEGYRDRYSQYRLDPDLQAAHAAHPWIMIWDDHEVLNDYDSSVDPQRRAEAYRAWVENQPVSFGLHNAAGLAPEAGDFKEGLTVYRSVDVGNLVRLCLIDVRQYANESSLLGEAQTDWLKGELEHDLAWTLLGSPVLVSGLLAPTDGPLLGYTWDGYPQERAELATILRGQDAVVVSGDLHTSLVLDMKADPLDEPETTAAPEFMAPAISSAFPADYAALAPLLSLFNPQMKHLDLSNGWLMIEVSEASVIAEFHLVADVSSPDSAVSIGPRFIVSRGDSRAAPL